MRDVVRTAFMCVAALCSSAAAQGQGDKAQAILPMLKQGGYVIVLRHGATDASQSDVYPLNETDMSKQRQLSGPGREAARQIGAALSRAGIPIGQVYTSRLNRAVETGRLISGKDVTRTADLNDSSAGSASAMAGQSGGGSARHGEALRRMAATPPAAGTNTLVVTHKTNVADAFGKDLADIAEGEAVVFKPEGGQGTVVARVKADAWGGAASGTR